MSGTAPPNSQTVQRELHLPSLPQFVVGLETALLAKGHSPEKARDLLTQHASAECLACGIKVKGEELLLLGPQSAAMDVSSKIARLRQGYCARQTCETYFYRVLLANLPDLDWAQLLAEAENSVAEQTAAPDVEQLAKKRLARKQLGIRLAVAAGILLVLLLAKQLYQGGRIPLLREPEKFEVDRSPPPDLMRR